jgi:AAA+ superfamily predicted ATPase
MSATGGWEDDNSEYLALSLDYLRLCLRRRRPVDEADRAALEDAIAAARAKRDGLAGRMAAPPALLWLAGRFGLTEFETHLLLLCAAVEYDPQIGASYADGPGPGREYPTFALALLSFDEPAWDALSPARPLRHWRLIEIMQGGAQPLNNSALRADERIVNLIKGLNQLDERLAMLLTPVDLVDPAIPLVPSQAVIARAVAELWRATPPDATPRIVQLLGSDATGKQMIAAHACAELGVRLLRIGCELLPQQPADIDMQARLWQRECLLMPMAVYVDLDAGGGAAEASLPQVRQFLGRIQGMALIGSRHAQPRFNRDHLVFEVGKPTPSEQEAAWCEANRSIEPAVAERLAAQFNLNQWEIGRIAREWSAEHDQDTADSCAVLWDSCRMSTRPRLDQLAARLDAIATWDDLVLPAEETAVLRQIAAQVAQRGTVYGRWGFGRAMNRGLGISALFAGDSGTGKTMAAEVIANALRLNLYRIDLSAVVSKYIGETEKNLCRLFDGAEDGGAILFFDEADALFGKRSEVSDSHDRFANIEINYLLQRIEAFRGIAILATNMKSALDTAFLRRLRFIVRFPFPRAADRCRIWQRAFPAQTPLHQIDFQHLAKLNLTGGNIHSAALNAAFLAAEAGSAVTMPIVLRALRSEYLKLERPINEADFHWLEPAQGAA